MSARDDVSPLRPWRLQTGGHLTAKVRGVGNTPRFRSQAEPDGTWQIRDDHRNTRWQRRKFHSDPSAVVAELNGQARPAKLDNLIHAINSLAVVKPALAAFWHPTRNGDLTPDAVTPGSAKKVWWRCERGHEWQGRVSLQGRRYCGACRALPFTLPELAKQWHPTRNGDLTPEDVTPGSAKKVWWQCERGHGNANAATNGTPKSKSEPVAPVAPTVTEDILCPCPNLS